MSPEKWLLPTFAPPPFQNPRSATVTQVQNKFVSLDVVSFFARKDSDRWKMKVIVEQEIFHM
jgi:hypothetical protein